MKKICDHCGAAIGKIEYNLSIAESNKNNYEDYYVCSEECLKNILHKRGIATYPAIDMSSLKRSKIAIVISVVAIAVQIIRTVMVIL